MIEPPSSQSPLMVSPVTLTLPDNLYHRLQNTAIALDQPLETIILRALQVGSPPSWEDIPPEYQADLARLDRLPDDLLWSIAQEQQSSTNTTRYETLLTLKQDRSLTPQESSELATLRHAADRLMLRKAQAAALLRWRGHLLPLS